MTTTALPPDTPTPEEQEQHLRPEEVSRRTFLFKLSIAANGIVGAIFAVPILGYLLGPALKKKKDSEFWVGLGPIEQFPEGTTRLVNFRNPSTTPWDGQTGEIPAWVRRISGNDFQVFAINCAHLGCPVRWFAQSKLFMCPCHGGAYYENGARASGPPERGLFEYTYKVDGGNLTISVGDLPTLARPGTKDVAGCLQARAAGSGNAGSGADRRRLRREKRGLVMTDPKKDEIEKKSEIEKGAIGIYNWLEFRLGLVKPAMEAASHPVPVKAASWWYVFGSAATILLGLQIVTGVLLALVYSSSANEAWNSLEFLNHNIALGWFLRAIHGWGSDFMVAIVLIHLCPGVYVRRV